MILFLLTVTQTQRDIRNARPTDGSNRSVDFSVPPPPTDPSTHTHKQWQSISLEESNQYGTDDGPRPFVERAAEIGIGGFVIPDLPAEEAEPLRTACDELGLNLVFIVIATTKEERLQRLLKLTSGFVYIQSRPGTTGAQDDISTQTDATLARIADWDVPKAVGFGITTSDHAERIVAAGADRVIIGSALVDIITAGNDNPTDEVASIL